ncbi:MAG TPA: DUF2889 domain-containing protein [Casimicrobiaceae bacterium]|jgi:hypothetical protein|nr:DUF2889 domain-containing protein [Casimicrobiaceae bacterium]
MPLKPSVARTRLHTRTAVCECFARDDGLFDVEAHLTDVKDHRYELMAGTRDAGEPVHDMWVRVTIDRELTIHAVEARMDRMPYPDACNRIEAAYAKLVGRNLARNFRLALHDAMGGVKGCTHLTELLGYLPTTAIQAFAGLTREIHGDAKPFQLDRCHALETSTDTVRRYYPAWYRGPAG